jgi:transposase InsO family protein
MCKVLGVSRSGYYNWLNQEKENMNPYQELDQQIIESFGKSRSNYGSPRVAQDLAKAGVIVSKSTVARRMQVLEIKAKRQLKYIVTTDSKHNEPIAPNILDRDFSASKPAQKWVSDLTYFRVGRVWHYLSVVIDLADRAVVGWTLSDNMTALHTTVEAFKKAINNRKPAKGMIFHSDRGVQYACQEFRQLLDQNKCKQSMSRKGNCWDNAVAESFFKTIKVECINQFEFLSIEQAYSIIFDYIDGWYNTKRIHSTLDGKSPAEAFNILNNEKLAA